MRKNSKNIRKTRIRLVSSACYERFLPLTSPSLLFLKQNGIGFSGISVLRDEYEIKRSSYHSHLLVYTLEGSGWIVINGQKQIAQAGQLWICPKGEPHHYGLSSAVWKVFWLSLKDIQPWSVIYQIGNRLKQSVYGDKIFNAMESIFWEFNFRETYSDKAIQLFSEQILLYLERELRLETHIHDQQTIHKLYKLLNKINEQVNFPWTVEQLAEDSELFVSPGHFSRLCLKHLGKAPIKLVIELRMEKAKELLRNTDYSLDSISKLTGYQNPFALSAAFKRHFKCSPRQFRKKFSL